jgi:hypothetical protein
MVDRDWIRACEPTHALFVLGRYVIRGEARDGGKAVSSAGPRAPTGKVDDKNDTVSEKRRRKRNGAATPFSMIVVALKQRPYRRQ